MEDREQSKPKRLIYRYRPLHRDLSAFLGIAFALSGCGLAGAGFYQGGEELRAYLIFGVFFFASGIYMITAAFRSHLLTEGTRIEIRGLFGVSKADLNDAEGYRTVTTGRGTSWQLWMRGGRSIFLIPSSFETDEGFLQWLKQAPDLDERDSAALIANIEDEQQVTEQLKDWMTKLGSARLRSIGLIIIVFISAIVLNVVPPVWQIPFAAILTLAPFVTAFLCWRSPSLYGLFKKKSDPRAETSYVLIVASFGLAASARDLQHISVQPLVLLMIIAGFAITAVNHPMVQRNASKNALSATLLFGVIFGFGAVVVANVAFDLASPRRYTAEVRGVNAENEHAAKYILHVSPWGPFEKESDVTVPPSLYFASHPGDLVCFDVHPGRLNGPWYRVVSCMDPTS